MPIERPRDARELRALSDRSTVECFAQPCRPPGGATALWAIHTRDASAFRRKTGAWRSRASPTVRMKRVLPPRLRPTAGCS